MITKAKLTQFRCFEALEVANLGRVNLVVGANGAGKTSLLEGIRLLRAEPVFLRANAVDDHVLSKLWDMIVASPAKDEVVAALRKLEPNICDVDLRADPQLPVRARVVLRIESGESSWAPIGSFGAGVSSMFVLALAAAATPGRLLLVDEIDAGLHHRVMADMWAMIIDTARRRDLQVFATTHSIDCLRALQRVCAADPDRGSAIRIVRVVKGRSSGITFDAEELEVAIEGEVEVRG